MKLIGKKLISFGLVSAMLLGTVQLAAFAEDSQTLFAAENKDVIDDNIGIFDDDNNDMFVYGDTTFNMNVPEESVYKLSLTYQSFEQTGVSISLNDEVVDTFDCNGISNEDFAVNKSELNEWNYYTKLNSGSNSLGVSFESEGDGIVYSLGLTKVQSYALDAETDGVQAVEVTYKSKAVASEGRAITFICGDNEYSIKHPTLDTTEASFIFDMDLAAGENYILAENGIEIVSASLYTGSSRRFMGNEFGGEGKITVYENGTTTENVWIGRANQDVVYKFNGETDEEAAKTKTGAVLNYYAPEAGEYNVSVKCGAIWWNDGMLYLNGEKQMEMVGICQDIYVIAPKTFSLTVKMEKGLNSFFMSSKRLANDLFVYYVDVEAPQTVKLNADAAGVAAVELKYKSKEAESANRAIKFACGDKTYQIKHPTLDATEASFIFDMDLAKGENIIKCESAGIEIVSADFYTALSRHFDGKEFANDGTSKTSVNGEEVTVSIGRASNTGIIYALEGESEESAAKGKTGAVLEYYAPADGKYNIAVKGGTIFWKDAYVYLNGKNILTMTNICGGATGQYIMPKEFSTTVEMKKGLNKIFMASFDDSRQTFTGEFFVDYVNIEAPQTISVNAEEAGVMPVELQYKSANTETVNRAISFTVGEKSYKVRKPALNETVTSVIFDMDLAKGENVITCDSAGIKLVSAAPYTGTSRHFIGYEFADNTKEMTLLSDGSKREVAAVSFDFNYELGGTTLTTGIALKFYAPEAGVYELGYSVGTEWWKKAIVWVNGNKVAEVGCDYYEGKIGLKSGTVTVSMNKGLNMICFTNANNDAQIYVDYVDLKKTDANKVTISDTADGAKQATAKLLNTSSAEKTLGLIVAQYDSTGNLADVKIATKVLAAGEVKDASVTYTATGAVLKTFIWDMGTLKPIK